MFVKLLEHKYNFTDFFWQLQDSFPECQTFFCLVISYHILEGDRGRFSVSLSAEYKSHGTRRGFTFRSHVAVGVCGSDTRQTVGDTVVHRVDLPVGNQLLGRCHVDAVAGKHPHITLAVLK
jgi:hypothetical protein